MAQVKNNLAPPQDSLAYQLATQPEAVAEAVPGAVPELRWYGPCNMTAPELLKWADRAYPARRRARGFLCDFLKDGPPPVEADLADRTPDGPEQTYGQPRQERS